MSTTVLSLSRIRSVYIWKPGSDTRVRQEMTCIIPHTCMAPSAAEHVCIMSSCNIYCKHAALPPPCVNVPFPCSHSAITGPGGGGGSWGGGQSEKGNIYFSLFYRQLKRPACVCLRHCLRVSMCVSVCVCRREGTISELLGRPVHQLMQIFNQRIKWKQLNA